jgi:protein TonB
MVVKCVISAQGRAERCRALKGLPSLDEAVLAALRARRYSPATFQGRAVAVDYLFKLCLRPPAR